MPLIGYILTVISGVAVIVFAALQYQRDSRPGKLITQIAAVVLILSAVVYFLGLPGKLIPKGPEENQKFLAAIAAIYVSIVLGMLAESFYKWFGKPKAKRRRKFDWGPTIQPLFVSPILLIPTIGAFQNANIDLMNLGFPSLMILLTAFEKGFLWRHYLAKSAEAATSKAENEPDTAAKGSGA
jgi:hypothetical protein